MVKTVDGSGITDEMWERQERMFDKPDVVTRLTGHREKPPRKRRLSATEKRDRDAQRRNTRNSVTQQLEGQLGRQPSKREIKRARGEIIPFPTKGQ